MAAYVFFFFFLFIFTANSLNFTSKHTHKWVGPIGHRNITVDANGNGDYTTVQAAVDSVSSDNRKNIFIHIAAGVYVYVYIKYWGYGFIHRVCLHDG